jgi:hypothetical protein
MGEVANSYDIRNVAREDIYASYPESIPETVRNTLAVAGVRTCQINSRLEFANKKRMCEDATLWTEVECWVPDFHDLEKTYTKVGPDRYVSSNPSEAAFLVYVNPFAIRASGTLETSGGIATFQRKMMAKHEVGMTFAKNTIPDVTNVTIHTKYPISSYIECTEGGQTKKTLRIINDGDRLILPLNCRVVSDVLTVSMQTMTHKTHTADGEQIDKIVKAADFVVNGENLGEVMTANFSRTRTAIKVGYSGHSHKGHVSNYSEYWLPVVGLALVLSITFMICKFMWGRHQETVAHDQAMVVYNQRSMARAMLLAQSQNMAAFHRDHPQPTAPINRLFKSAYDGPMDALGQMAQFDN